MSFASAEQLATLASCTDCEVTTRLTGPPVLPGGGFDQSARRPRHTSIYWYEYIPVYTGILSCRDRPVGRPVGRAAGLNLALPPCHGLSLSVT